MTVKLGPIEVRSTPRKLNQNMAVGMGKSAAAGLAALAYDDWIVKPVVNRTILDQKMTIPEVAISLLVGWGPLLAAAALSTDSERGDFWDSLGGAIAYKRIANLGTAVSDALQARGIVG